MRIANSSDFFCVDQIGMKTYGLDINRITYIIAFASFIYMLIARNRNPVQQKLRLSIEADKWEAQLFCV